MRQVWPAEAGLVDVARALVGAQRVEAVADLLAGARGDCPPAVSPDAAALIAEALERGIGLQLARRGGWRRRSQQRDSETLVSGRLWERHAAPEWTLSAGSFQLCRWLAGARESTLPPLRCEADQLMAYLACDLVDRADAGDALFAEPAIRDAALCRLAFPHRFAAEEAMPELSTPLAVEALQDDLARHWRRCEAHKVASPTLDAQIRIGDAQQRCLDALEQACERWGRRDLAGFVLRAADTQRSAADRIRAAPDETLAQRSRAAESHGVVLRKLATFKRWADEARAVPFFEEGYDVARHYLRIWEVVGDAGYARAERILTELAALDATVTRGAAP